VGLQESGGGGDINDGNDDVQLLIDQSQRLCEVYDGRRTDADSTATQLLTASIGLVTLTITGTVIGPSTPPAGKGFALAVTAAGAVSTFLAVWARSISGLRPAPAIHRTGDRYVAEGKPKEEDYLETDVACLRGSSPLSHESTAFRVARAELDYLEGIDNPDLTPSDDPQNKVLRLWRAREADLHWIAKQKEKVIAYSGIALLLATLFAATTGAFVLFK